MRLVHFAKYSLLAASLALAGGAAGIATAGSAAAQGWGGHNHGGFHNDHRGWNRGRDWRPHRPGLGFVAPRGPRCTIQYRMVRSPYGPVRRPVRVCF